MLRPWTLLLNIERKHKTMPLYQLLASELQRLIATGVLHPGDALPSSRELAQQLKLSRKTVVTAMAQLEDSGLLMHKERVGLFVARTLDGTSGVSPEESLHRPTRLHLTIDEGLTDPSLMPAKLLMRAYGMIFTRMSKLKLQEPIDFKGVESFRRSIATGISLSRGINATTDEVLISSGNKHTVYLIARTLLHPGDTVAVEAMCRECVIETFRMAGLRVIEIPVDADGMRVDCLERELKQDPTIRSVFATTHFHYPTTVPLSAERRKQLAALVTEHDLLLMEDDFDSFTHLSGNEQLPVASLLPKRNYVYFTSAIRILSISVRVGLVTSSLENIERMTHYLSLIDQPGNITMQRAILELIEQGEIRRHIRTQVKTYGERLEYISQAIRRELGNQVHYRRPEGGLAIWIELPYNPSLRLQNKGIDVNVIELPNGRFGLRIGYASLSKRNVDQLIEALKR